jgi:cysteine synthase
MPDMFTDNVLNLIGNTPLVRLRGENIYAKAEFLNPGGSIKDRVALAMIEGAERDGRLNANSIIVEPTSGNTGIGVALIGRLKGYRVRIVMPEGMSEERKKIIRALGAELILTPDEESIGGAVKRVREMAAADPRVFVPQQFENRDNPRCHYETTARELWQQLDGRVDCFVAGVGSGGTLQGVGTFLKEHKPNARIVAVEPKNVSALLGHEPGLHQIQGIGDGFIPAVLNITLVDEVIEVTDEDAIETTRQLGRDLGLLVGISSGANVWAARQLDKRGLGNIATVLPDRAERYFSTALL